MKELLLQIHNHKMQKDYNTLIDNRVDMWSVEADAFVIRREHSSKAKKAVTFNNNIGAWSHEKGKLIALLTEKDKMKENALTTIPEYINETLEIKDK